MSIAPRPIVEPLCRLDELPERRSRGFDPLGEGRDTLFLVRLEERVFAWRNACPHYEFARMAWKKDEFLAADHRLILCGAHGALFDIVDGHCVKGPCEGQRLTAVPLELRDGAVHIVGDYAPGLRRHQRRATAAPVPPQAGDQAEGDAAGQSPPSSPTPQRGTDGADAR